MYDDKNWTAITSEELTKIMEQVSPVDGKYAVSSETTQAVARTLPFYDHVTMIRLTDPTWTKENLKIYYLIEQGNLYRLNGTSPPIHAVNEKTQINLTDENVLDYLRFFSFFVRGDEGPFLIVEDMNNPDLPQDMDAECKRVFKNAIRPARLESKNEQDSYLCNAPVFYSNTLSFTNFEVSPSGTIEMQDHEMLAADLPIKANASIN